MREEVCSRSGRNGGTTGVEQGEGEAEAEAEEEVGERLAQREGRRRLVGRTGLENLFRDEEEEEEDLSLTWRETKWITRLRSGLFWW